MRHGNVLKNWFEQFFRHFQRLNSSTNNFLCFFFNWQGVNQRTMDHWIPDARMVTVSMSWPSRLLGTKGVLCKSSLGETAVQFWKKTWSSFSTWRYGSWRFFLGFPAMDQLDGSISKIRVILGSCFQKWPWIRWILHVIFGQSISPTSFWLICVIFILLVLFT